MARLTTRPNFLFFLRQCCQMVHFKIKKSRFESILEGLEMEEVGIFYCHLVYFVKIWYTCVPFWYAVPKKSGNPEIGTESET
jgi:hypothetical protein